MLVTSYICAEYDIKYKPNKKGVKTMLFSPYYNFYPRYNYYNPYRFGYPYGYYGYGNYGYHHHRYPWFGRGYF